MYSQLRQGGAAGGGMVSWRRMFDFLLSICQLYADIEADTRVRSCHSCVCCVLLRECQSAHAARLLPATDNYAARHAAGN